MNYDPEIFDQIRWAAVHNPTGAILTLCQVVEELVREGRPEPEPEPAAPECYQFMGGGSLPK
jgi:hypothetical protein